MRTRYAEFDILRVEFVALIEMLSGSPRTDWVLTEPA